MGVSDRCVVAVVMVRRGSLFNAAVQPPLVFISAVLKVFAVSSCQRISMILILIQITDAFPTLATGSVLVLVVALLRLGIQRIPPG